MSDNVNKLLTIGKQSVKRPGAGIEFPLRKEFKVVFNVPNTALLATAVPFYINASLVFAAVPRIVEYPIDELPSIWKSNNPFNKTL